MIDWKNTNVLVTGASGAIGSAIVKAMHKLGAHLYISGSNIQKLEALGAELGDNYTIKQCDLSNSAEVHNLLDNIDRLEVLICNAGITRDNLSIKMSLEDFQSVINVNLTSNFILNQLAIKKMMRARYGRIINISSIVAVSGNPGQVNYCASKAGLIGMTKSLAMEVATRSITVNAIAPGFIHSNMTEKLTDAQKNAILNKIPSKNMGNADDIANAAIFLAGPKSSYITGQTLHVNGGMLMV